MTDNELLTVIKEALDGKKGLDQILIARTGLTVTELLLRKNRNYGSSVFKPPILAPDVDVDAAIRVRMSDKIARLCTLLGGEKDEVGESIADTTWDLIGYLILEVAWWAKNKEQNCE